MNRQAALKIIKVEIAGLMARLRIPEMDDMEDIQENNSQLPVGVGIVSNPPPGCYPVLNVYVNQAGELCCDYDDQT